LKNTQAQNLLPNSFSQPLKKRKKLNKNIKTRKIADILKTARNIAKSSKLEAQAMLQSVL